MRRACPALPRRPLSSRPVLCRGPSAAGSPRSRLAGAGRHRLLRHPRPFGEPAAADGLDPALGRADPRLRALRQSLARHRALERPGPRPPPAARLAGQHRPFPPRPLAGRRRSTSPSPGSRSSRSRRPIRPSSPAPSLVYWLLILVLAVARGRGLARAAARSSPSISASIAGIAPLWAETAGRPVAAHGRPARRADPGDAAARPPAAAFVTLVLASVSFDGLRETFWWLARLGINPLDFPGRSAVVGVNTARPARRLGADRGADPRRDRPRPPPRAGRRPFCDGGRARDARLPADRRRLPRRPLPRRAARPTANTRSPRWTIPSARGWSLFGLPDHWVSFGFLADTGQRAAIWNTQFALILGAHLLAVLLGLRCRAAAGARRPGRTCR